MRGFSQVRSKLVDIPDKVIEAGQEGVKEVGENILEESQFLVPVDTGALQASGDLNEKGSGKKYTVTVSYDTDYATYVHEIMHTFHPVGQAKYLRIPFKKHIPSLPTTIESKLRGKI